MTDPHTRQGQTERAKRLRQQIENLKSGVPRPDSPEHQKSIREQVEERAREIREHEQEKP